MKDLYIRIFTGGGKAILFVFLASFSLQAEFKTLDSIIEKAAQRLFEKPLKEKFLFLSENTDITENDWLLLDISGYCNGNFSTWVGGGFNLKYIETGRKTYYGVPFEILSEEKHQKTCIMTKSEILEGVNELNIPINRYIKAVYFLHANYYASPEEKGERNFVFEYEDGSIEKLNLVGGENMFDWFPQTRTETDDLKYVLVRTSEGFKPPYRNLYVMQWKNPHPDKKLRSIGFYSDGKGMRATIIIAITLLLENR